MRDGYLVAALVAIGGVVVAQRSPELTALLLFSAALVALDAWIEGYRAEARDARRRNMARRIR